MGRAERIKRFVSAAYQHIATGSVLPTGEYHRPHYLPSPREEWRAGFLSANGRFYNREQATWHIRNREAPLLDSFDFDSGLYGPAGPRVTLADGENALLGAGYRREGRVWRKG